MIDTENITFPVGYHPFHKKQLYNYQLNRWYSMGYFRYEDITDIGPRITTFASWRSEMKKLAEKAIKEGRDINGAFFYRAAEFYTFDESGEKEKLYEQFSEYFYKACKKENINRFDIPYKSRALPAIRIPAQGKKEGTILLHGGFDSFIEEWYLMMKYLSQKGFEVIGFEGPGQGAALRKYNLPFTIEWEKPVKAVLDHLNLEDVCLFGLSMGGWLCLRAAAFESRITRVIANGHSIDYLKSLPYILYLLHKWMLDRKSLQNWMNKVGMKGARGEGLEAWMSNQLMHISMNKNRPMEAFKVWLALNDENIHSEKITQDVFVISGAKDHFIPIKMHKRQVKALIKAKSVSDKIFTKKEEAQNHCQIGNIQLMLDTVSEWLMLKGGS